jgi:hypothetical protein
MADHGTPSPEPGPLADFLHPQSMVTPGLLGAAAMMGTNALCATFPLDEPIVCLVLSLLFGLAAVIRDARLLQRVLYYVLNTIIIFSVAAGANTVGLASQAKFPTIAVAYAEEGAAPLSHSQMAGGFFRPWFPSKQQKEQQGAPPIEPNRPSGHTGHAHPPDRNSGSPPPPTAPPSPQH